MNWRMEFLTEKSQFLLEKSLQVLQEYPEFQLELLSVL